MNPSMATGHAIKVTYLNKRGEEHMSLVYGTEPLRTDQCRAQQAKALQAGYAIMGRTVLDICEIEAVQTTMPMCKYPTAFKLVSVK